MTTLTIHTNQNNPTPDDTYASGFLDGELDAISNLPAHLHTARASWGDLYNPIWAQGYTDGFIHATTLNTLNPRQETSR